MGNTESTSASKRQSTSYPQLRLTTSNGDLHDIYRIQNVQGSLETLDSMDEPPHSVVSAPGFIGAADDKRMSKIKKIKKRRTRKGKRTPEVIPGSPYMLVHTNAELDRINVQHFLVKELRRTNIIAPIPDQARILDVGCSNGAWVLDVALENKNADVFGVDYVEVFPKEIKPKNTTFCKANVLDGLPFADDYFDLVHVRFMMTSFRSDDWPQLLDECYRVCKPNGYVELTDIDGEPLDCGPRFTTFCQEANKVFETRELDPCISRKFDQLLKKSGFAQVESSHVSAKIGEWGSKHGILQKENMINTFLSAKDFFTSIWRIKAEEFEDRLYTASAELEEYEGYYNICTSFGKKPSHILYEIYESPLRMDEELREYLSNDSDDSWSTDEEDMTTLAEEITMKPEEKDIIVDMEISIFDDREEEEYDENENGENGENGENCENGENDENDEETAGVSHRRRFAPKYQLYPAPPLRRLTTSPTYRYPVSPTFEPKNTYE